jgi:uncharacterized protein YgbK (DUF1537 family)
MTLVLADDLTGLTELAGLAANAGLRGWLYPALDAWRQEPAPGPAPRFVNLACRMLSPDEAAVAVREALAIAPARPEHVYLKVDSVGRGPVLAMLAPLLGDRPGRLPLLLTNPTTVRAVRAGRILVENVPLDQTPFRDDPTHPTASAELRAVLAAGLPEAQPAERERLLKGLVLLDGVTEGDIEAAAERWRTAVVAAGAAPFGAALLRRWCPPAITSDETEDLPFRRTFAVVGTAHEAGAELARQFQALGGTLLYADEPAGRPLHLPLMLTSPRERGDAAGVLANLMDRAVNLFERLDPQQILLTGGETAEAFLARLDWPELVAISYRHPIALLSARLGTERKHVLLKPGSYQTPNLLTDLFTV